MNNPKYTVKINHAGWYIVYIILYGSGIIKDYQHVAGFKWAADMEVFTKGDYCE